MVLRLLWENGKLGIIKKIAGKDISDNITHNSSHREGVPCLKN
jgi:hypothetical protein